MSECKSTRVRERDRESVCVCMRVLVSECVVGACEQVYVCVCNQRASPDNKSHLC